MASERCKAGSGGLRAQSKWSSIAFLTACEVMALALWFSVSAVIPALKSEFALDDVQVSLLTSSVAVGFVIGTLASALLGLADRLRRGLELARQRLGRASRSHPFNHLAEDSSG